MEEVAETISVGKLVDCCRLFLLELAEWSLLSAAVLALADFWNRWNETLDILLLVLADLISHLFLVLFTFFLALAVFFLLLTITIIWLSFLSTSRVSANFRDEKAAKTSSLFCYTNSLIKADILLDSKSCRSS